MSDDTKPSTLDLGLYAQGSRESRITLIEVVAMLLTVVWVATVAMLGLSEGDEEGGMAGAILTILAVVLPVALIWVGAMAARTARGLRQEAARLQASIDAMRAAYVDQQHRHALELKPEIVRKLDELVSAMGHPAPDGNQPSRDMPLLTEQPRAAVVSALEPAQEDAPQRVLNLAVSDASQGDPISIDDFIKALNFPDNEHDREGFRTLRRALQDRGTERLIRASQDVLTLLSQDGIYMDDLRPDRARPEVWRRFARGERGRAIASLGGIHDRSSLVLTGGRMKKDPIFRDAAHHFLRNFDRTFMEFEGNASDEEIARLADTRTARAFMLVGRVAGTFD